MQKHNRLLAIILLLTLLTASGLANPLDQAIQEAMTKQEAGDIAGAIKALQSVDNESQYNPAFLAYMGLFKGQMAGQTEDMMEAGQLATESFGLLNRAIQMDSSHVKARLFRGTMSMFVPDFMGKLDEGIQDLETVLQCRQTLPDQVSMADVIQTHAMLIVGYDKKGQIDRANWMRKEIITLAPGSPSAQQAEAHFKDKNIDIDSVEQPVTMKFQKKLDVETMKQQAGQAMHESRHKDAIPVLKELVNAGLADQKVFGMLMTALNLASKEYNASVHENTDHRTNLAFDVVNTLDKAVQAFPDDLSWRHTRGSVCVMMPYFLNRLDSGLEDLKMVIEKTDNDSLKAEALFWLGYAYQRKGQSEWYKVATKLPKQPAFQRILQQTRPNIQRLNTHNLDKPLVTVEFTIAFQDQLAPQTAVWVEDENGKHVKTLYVSGFSGFVKDKQIVLPKWARASGFEGVESVTGASIDVGHYTYAWDCRTLDGKKAPKGKYTMKVEVSHWPSYKHQLVAVPFTLGKKNDSITVKEGSFLPYVKVTCINK